MSSQAPDPLVSDLPCIGFELLLRQEPFVVRESHAGSSTGSRLIHHA